MIDFYLFVYLHICRQQQQCAQSDIAIYNIIKKNNNNNSEINQKEEMLMLNSFLFFFQHIVNININ